MKRKTLKISKMKPDPVNEHYGYHCVFHWPNSLNVLNKHNDVILMLFNLFQIYIFCTATET